MNCIVDCHTHEAKDIILEVDVLKVSRGSSSGVVKLIQEGTVCTVFNGICFSIAFIFTFSFLPSAISLIKESNSKDYLSLHKITNKILLLAKKKVEKKLLQEEELKEEKKYLHK